MLQAAGVPVRRAEPRLGYGPENPSAPKTTAAAGHGAQEPAR